MELGITIGIIFFVFIFSVLRANTEMKKRKQKYREKLRQQYGNFPNREYKIEELESIPRLFEHQMQDNDFYIDDITWNDLNMDQIYELINHTQSSSGAEYLYKMLRVPMLNSKNEKELEEDITYFMENEKARMDLQMIFHNLGRTGRFSLFDYLDYLDTLEQKNNKKEIVAFIGVLLSVLCIFIKTEVGVVLFLLLSCYQIITYLKEKKKVLPYLSSFTYVMRMCECADQIINENVHERKKINEQLKQIRDKLAAFKKTYHILMQMNSSTGNPIELILEYFKMITHLDIMKFNRTLSLVLDKREEIIALANQLGYLDSVISIGAFRSSLPFYCVPELSSDEKLFIIQDGYHPAIKDAVPNSFCQERGMLLTGSNASGKSTFLKMTAINAILAQTIHTCAAKKYIGNYYQLYSSMSLRDNLENGESYYIVEIKALKRIMDVVNQMEKEVTGVNPLLCFVDEVLRGTNTVERIAASTKILEALNRENVFCFAATHDIELTHVLETKYDNYHFEEEVKNGDVLFSYHLQNGRAVSRNAIRLLQVIGFPETIISNADDMAARFLDTGEWRA